MILNKRNLLFYHYLTIILHHMYFENCFIINIRINEIHSVFISLTFSNYLIEIIFKTRQCAINNSIQYIFQTQFFFILKTYKM